MASNNDEDMAMLMSMGFDRDQSLEALNACGSLERAIDFLLSGGGGGTSSSSVNAGHPDVSRGSGIAGQININDDVRAVHSELSQYSDSLGRSACTSISLTMACNLLNATATTTTIANSESESDTPESIIDSAFLSNSILEGIKMYSDLKKNNYGGVNVEHSSVEEILNACNNAASSNNYNSTSKKIVSSLNQFDFSPRQGMLSKNNSLENSNPIGLETILSQCQADATDLQSYIAVVITKPPETVLVILPPIGIRSHSSSSPTSTLTSTYILLDSHPRPQQLSPHFPSGSYALFHPTLSSLVASVEQIFPVTDLGGDVPEMMAAMYNSFDVYPFQCRMRR